MKIKNLFLVSLLLVGLLSSGCIINPHEGYTTFKGPLGVRVDSGMTSRSSVFVVNRYIDYSMEVTLLVQGPGRIVTYKGVVGYDVNIPLPCIVLNDEDVAVMVKFFNRDGVLVGRASTVYYNAGRMYNHDFFREVYTPYIGWTDSHYRAF